MMITRKTKITAVFLSSMMFSRFSLADTLPISSCQQLQDIAQNPSGDYVLINNIDCSHFNWTPIAHFTGSLTGKNPVTHQIHSIKNINAKTSNNLHSGGIFDTVENAKIQDLNLHSISLYQPGFKQGVGVLAGYGFNSTFKNISLRHSSLDGWDNVAAGLLVGQSISSKIDTITIDASNSKQNQSGTSGLIVGNFLNGELTNSVVKDSHLIIKNSVGGMLNGFGGAIGSAGDTQITKNIIARVKIENAPESPDAVMGGEPVGGLVGHFTGKSHPSSTTHISFNQILDTTINGNMSEFGGLVGSLFYSPDSATQNMEIAQNQINNVAIKGPQSYPKPISAGGMMGKISCDNTYVNAYCLNLNLTNNAVNAEINLLRHNDKASGFIGSIYIYYPYPAFLPVYFKITNNYAAIKNTGAIDNTVPFLPATVYYDLGAISGNFWNQEISNLPISNDIVGITALNTAQMKSIDPYLAASWDFEKVWTLKANAYPSLRYE